MSGKRKKKLAVWSGIVLMIAIVITLVAMKAAGKTKSRRSRRTRPPPDGGRTGAWSW
jgi:hypothetical protein